MKSITMSLSRCFLTLYSLFLLVVVFFPRSDQENTPKRIPTISKEGTIPEIAHSVLYLNGWLEIFGNFFLMVPIAFFMNHGYPRIKLRKILIICVPISISIEVIQKFVPGRVSDVNDFLLNSTGVALTLVAIWVFSYSSKS
jgi:glycopeptide antibiotics resistance protein